MHKFVAGLLISIVSFTSSADTYDPTTNKLFIPSITVDGIVYSDVYVTVGEILSIGSSVPLREQNDRTCSFTVEGITDLQNIKFDLTVLPQIKAIRVSMTGLSNSSIFDPSSILLIQGSNSTDLTIYGNIQSPLWVGDYGYTGGYIPEGVIKGGVISKLPDWMDLSLPLKLLISGEEHIC